MRKRVMDRMERARLLKQELMTRNEFFVDNGKFSLTETCEVHHVRIYNPENCKSFLEFVKKHPNPYIAMALDDGDEMDTILLSEKPVRLEYDISEMKITGTGIIGCATVIENAPKRLLVLDDY